MEIAAAAGRALVHARSALAHAGARGPRRVVGAGFAAPGRRRVPLVAVASPPEPLPSRAAAVAPQAGVEVHGDEVGAAAAAAETSSPSVVRVRFVLKKQLPFGQNLHLVGDDPALGLWDPSQAAALEWAEGHDWIVEKDLPANKLVEFKFLLRDSLGKLHWQNGPNRSLQTGETANTLVVYEDWVDMKKQKISEEGKASIGMEEAAVVSDEGESEKDIVSENVIQINDNQEINEYEIIVAEEYEKSDIATHEDEKLAVATNACDQGQSVKGNEAIPPESTLHEELKILDGLHEKKDAENGSASCSDESSAETNEDDNILSEDGVSVESGLTSAFEHDLLWGWKALQRLLMSLGFKTDTT